MLPQMPSKGPQDRVRLVLGIHGPRQMAVQPLDGPPLRNTRLILAPVVRPCRLVSGSLGKISKVRTDVGSSTSFRLRWPDQFAVVREAHQGIPNR